MKEHEVCVAGKIATQITTSKHFYDVTAHRYIQDNCQEMGMNYIRGLSADMEDLPTKKGQAEAKAFWEHFLWCISEQMAEPCYLRNSEPKNRPVHVPEPVTAPDHGNVVIITDALPENTQLNAMIARFQAVLPVKSRIVNISDYPLKGGCLGCSAVLYPRNVERLSGNIRFLFIQL
jgi:hypothetical protein